jgi:hypothetical protein
MKAKDFGRFVESLAEMLRAAGATEQAGAWLSILRIFQTKPSAKVSDVCQVLSDIDVDKGNHGAMVRSVGAFIPSLRRCLSDSTKNKALIEDLELFDAMLVRYAEFPISNFVDICGCGLALSPAARSVATRRVGVSGGLQSVEGGYRRQGCRGQAARSCIR